jgi:hypothetical protein
MAENFCHQDIIKIAYGDRLLDTCKRRITNKRGKVHEIEVRIYGWQLGV